MDDILYDYVQDEEVLNQVKATGIEDRVEALEATGTTVNPGYRVDYSNSQINFNPTAQIVTVTGSSVTLEPDTAYKIVATSSSVTLNANIPATGYWGYEGHAEIFVASTGYIVTGLNVYLANALEPDAVNNCTIRFHDGKCIISVEDHIAGYVVTVASGNTAGTLPYALHDVSREYIAFDATLNGQTIDMGGAVTSAGEKHVVGNGYTETILTGGVSCTSKTTFSNLSMDGAYVTGGKMTLGDVFIPQGATVSVSGGGLAVEKVSGSGGVIDLGGTNVVINEGTAYASGCVISGGSASSGGAFRLSASISNSGYATLTDCTITGNTAGAGAAIYAGAHNAVTMSGCTITGNRAIPQGAYFGGVLTAEYNRAGFILSNCTVSGNTLGNGPAVRAAYNNTFVTLSGGCVIEGNINVVSTGRCTLAGSNVIDSISGTAGSVTISSGAIIDLTGNANATPINPGGAIVIPARLGDDTATVQINYTDSVTGDPESRRFDELAIRGTTITNQGIIYGATVTIPAEPQETWFLNTTEGTVTLTYEDAGDYVVTGGLTGVERS